VRAFSSPAEDSRGTLANVPPQGGRKHPHQDFIQIDTTTFVHLRWSVDGLDKISRSGGEAVDGFWGREPHAVVDRERILERLMPEDLSSTA